MEWGRYATEAGWGSQPASRQPSTWRADLIFQFASKLENHGTGIRRLRAKLIADNYLGSGNIPAKWKQMFNPSRNASSL